MAVVPAIFSQTAGALACYRLKAENMGLSPKQPTTSPPTTSDRAVAFVTPKQVELVRQLFDSMWPVRRKLADQFYRRFFELAPDAQGFGATWKGSTSN
jgi:hypothetical protein